MHQPSSTSERWKDGGKIALQLRTLADRFRSSLFGVPSLWVLASLVLSRAAVSVDRYTASWNLPGFFDTTVDSARAILGAVASGTIAAASVVFSLTLVAIQLASSVYSSRVLRTFLRDRFQQHMTGIVVSTFLFSLLLLREVRDPLAQGGEPYIPRISTVVAVVFALAAVLALLASISHTAQSLRASSVTARLSSDLLSVVHKRFPMRNLTDGADAAETDAAQVATAAPSVAPSALSSKVSTADHPGPTSRRHERPHGAVLTSPVGGWVQQVSIEAILDAVPADSEIQLEVGIGSYVYADAPLLTLWPAPPSQELEALSELLRAAIVLGEERTLQQDVEFGIIMLEDVALRALSPGVNDPNTAISVIPMLGEVVLCILERKLPDAEARIDGCAIFRPLEPTYADYVNTSFDQLRRCSRDMPRVQLELARTLIRTSEELERRRRSTPSALDSLRTQLALIDSDCSERIEESANVTAPVGPFLAEVREVTGRYLVR